MKTHEDFTDQDGVCDRCGNEPVAPAFNAEPKLYEDTYKGREGHYCFNCLRNAPGFCEICYTWSFSPFDGHCLKCGLPVVCPDCQATWNLAWATGHFDPGYIGDHGGPPGRARPPEPPEYCCPACNSPEQPIQLRELKPEKLED